MKTLACMIIKQLFVLCWEKLLDTPSPHPLHEIPRGQARNPEVTDIKSSVSESLMPLILCQWSHLCLNYPLPLGICYRKAVLSLPYQHHSNPHPQCQVTQLSSFLQHSACSFPTQSGHYAKSFKGRCLQSNNYKMMCVLSNGNFYGTLQIVIYQKIWGQYGRPVTLMAPIICSFVLGFLLLR